jgi:predicted nucleic acid-binding protein
MFVVVDSSVWSLALRRRKGVLSPSERILVDDLGNLIDEGRVKLMGLVRHELLCGIREHSHYESLRIYLRGFPDVPIDTADYELAATISNSCRSVGIASSTVDSLICAVASARNWTVFTTDEDFKQYLRVQPLGLHTPHEAGK